jgi:transcription initiation factor IIF auxiliary subunit
MGFWDDKGIKFKKSGIEVKQAINNRLEELEERLSIRNQELDKVMSDKGRLRMYLVRDTDNDYPHSSQMRQDLPTEEHQRIKELCKRICLIEKEIKKLSLTRDNIKDEQDFELSYEEICSLGFGPKGNIYFA